MTDHEAEEQADDLPEQMRVRRDKRDRLISSGREPYAVRLPVTHSLAQVRAAYPDLDIDVATGDRVGVAGRVIFQRNTGVHFSESIFFTPTDVVAPTVVSQAPAASATNVDPNANLTITFSEAIKRGLGSIELRTAAGALVETFANTSPRVTSTKPSKNW